MKQSDALKKMLTGTNIFLTGAPGAGKTYVLNQFIDAAEEKGLKVAITASTGIAASHIGGTTIHSWSGLGISDEVTKNDLLKLKNNSRIVKRYNRTDVLVIDEVSMLHGKRLDMVNIVAKALRGSDQPFGGMQIILVGDLFQLPPVSRDSNDYDFAHYSESWQELLLHICYITEHHRQSDNDRLLGLLEAMRNNVVNEDHTSLLESVAGTPAPDNITKLFTHNVDVDMINQTRLDALPGKIKKFKMVRSGDKFKIEALERNILAPANLELKEGAEVMFVANNFQAGFVNGTRGTVIKFKSGEPIVKLKSGRVIRVERHSWKTVIDDKVVAEVEQIPLRLAWAITIHKSQGMSLDAAEIDLSKAFMPGMGYVALSRVRSMEGLYLKGFNAVSLRMHPAIYAFDADLRAWSEQEIS